MSSNDKELTGGSGDVNPNMLLVNVIQTAVDADTILTVPVPVPRACGPCPKGKAYVLEILRIKTVFEPGLPAVLPVVTTTFIAAIAAGNANPDPANSNTFYTTSEYLLNGSNQIWVPQEDSQGLYDDGAGHGLLVTAQQMRFEIISKNSTLVQTCHFRVFYRFKLVDIVEIVNTLL